MTLDVKENLALISQSNVFTLPPHGGGQGRGAPTFVFVCVCVCGAIRSKSSRAVVVLNIDGGSRYGR